MTVESYTTQLERVQTAIAAVEERGSSVSAEGITLTRADLKTLYAREERLRVLAGREARGGGIQVRGVTPSDG